MADHTDKNISTNDDLKKGLLLSEEYYRLEGKQPRILIGGTIDPLSRSMNRLCNSLADMGYDVDLSPKLKALKSLATQSLENDADAILICSEDCFPLDELLDFQNHVLSNQPDIIVSLYLNNRECISTLEQHLNKWTIFGTNSDAYSLGHNVLRQLMHTS